MKRVLKWLLAIGFLGVLVFGVWLIFWVKILDLPGFGTFKDYRPYQTAYFLDKNNEIIGCVARENGWRDVLGSEEVKDLLIAKIILSVEDRRFYERDFWAVDFRAMLRAILEDAKARRIVEGGSTIPQQLVKQLLPPEERAEKSISRKIKEAILAFQLLRNFTKDEILALYLNEIYLGHQRYGIEAAARLYFNKSARNLSLSDAAIIAGIIKSPEKLSPKKYPERAKAKRDDALKKAYEEGFVSEEDYQKAFKEKIVVSDDFQKSCQLAQHAADDVKFRLKSEDEFKNLKLLFDDEGKNDAWFGFRAVTTLDSNLQALGQEAVNSILESYRNRAKENALPDVDGAFVVLEIGSGRILAMVGSGDYKKNQFNNVRYSTRQVGSSFKPVVYAAFFEGQLAVGESRETILDLKIANGKLGSIRCPKVINPKGPEDWWVPKNFDEPKFQDAYYTRRFAIAQSINRAAVNAARIGQCGLHPRVIKIAERLGIKTKLDPYLPTALGAGGIPIIELAAAYGVFADKGVLRTPYLIEKIYDSRGGVLYEKKEWAGKQAVSPDVASVMLEALRGVVKYGTAKALNFLPQPVAGKTGTTNNFTDALFTGVTPHIAFSAWIGGTKDNANSLGDRITGGSMVVPAIKNLLEKYYAGYEPEQFQEEVEGWSKIIVDPKAFQQEMQELEKKNKEEGKGELLP